MLSDLDREAQARQIPGSRHRLCTLFVIIGPCARSGIRRGCLGSSGAGVSVPAAVRLPAVGATPGLPFRRVTSTVPDFRFVCAHRGHSSFQAIVDFQANDRTGGSANPATNRRVNRRIIGVSLDGCQCHCQYKYLIFTGRVTQSQGI